jgi:intracellular multiplication protein IcmO
MQDNTKTTKLLSNSIDTLISNNPTVNDFKRKAKVLHNKLKEDYKAKKKTDFIPLRQCQDLVAQQYDYKHWHEFHTTIKKLYLQKKDNHFFKYDINSQTPTFSSGKRPINMGYNPKLGLQGWYDQDHLLVHSFIEGSSNFRQAAELHIIKQLMKEGQHIVYMSGENNTQHIDNIITEAKKAGRENDLRILSFMTPSQRMNTMEQMKWYLPKNLPFSSGQLTEILISLMDFNGVHEETGKMWKGRAISLMSSLIMALIYMRDNKEVILDFALIREYLIFKNLVSLSKRKDLPIHVVKSLHTYLNFLPNYVHNSTTQPDSVLEQHGYLQMMFTKMLGALDDSYHYLFKGDIEVSKAQEQINELYGSEKKLIFIIDFPNFSKSSQELNLLSYLMLKIITTNLSSKIGESIQGESIHKNSQLKQKINSTIIINNCPLPDGFAVSPAQFHYCHTGLILSYDITNNYHNMCLNKEEVISILVNMNIKLNGTISDNITDTINQKWHYKLISPGVEEDLIL